MWFKCAETWNSSSRALFFLHSLSFVCSRCCEDVTVDWTECNEKPISCFWHQTANTLIPPETGCTLILLSPSGPRPRPAFNCFSWPFCGSLIKRRADMAKHLLLWLEIWLVDELLLLLQPQNSIITSIPAPCYRAEESGDTGGIGGWLWLMASH